MDILGTIKDAAAGEGGVDGLIEKAEGMLENVPGGQAVEGLIEKAKGMGLVEKAKDMLGTSDGEANINSTNEATAETN